jgi:uncharacterized membrane protein YczE
MEDNKVKNRPSITYNQALMYAVGCLLFSIGAKFFIDSGLGTDPLDVLVIGLNIHLKVGMGVCSAIVAIFFS